MELLEEIQYHIKGKLQTCVSSHIGAYEEMLNFINKIEKREQEKPAKEEREWGIGKVVRITDNKFGHDFSIGDEVNLLKKHLEQEYAWLASKGEPETDESNCWWITTEEAELIEKSV